MADNKNSKRGFYIVLIIVLLLINALLFYSTFQNKAEREKLEAQKELAEKEKAALEIELDETIAELESYRSDNAEMNKMIDSLKEEITIKAGRIDQLLSSSNFSSRKLKDAEKMLADARATIDSLRQQSQGYVYALDSMNNAYVELVGRYDTLSEMFGQQTRKMAEIQDQRDSIKTIGSILQVNTMTATGVKSKKSGKESENSRAKGTEKIKICFELLPNRLVARGPQTLLLKITGPGGTTLALENKGSGVFVNMDNGEESMYTSRLNIDYDIDQKDYCVYWSQNTEFTSGDYNAELFHKGYRIGEQRFQLK